MYHKARVGTETPGRERQMKDGDDKKDDTPPVDDERHVTAEGRQDGEPDDRQTEQREPWVAGGDEKTISDPVKEAYDGQRDLYEIATWEQRSLLDRVVVSLVGTVARRKRDILIALAFSLFLAQVVIAGLVILESPVLGLLSLLSIIPALLLVVTIWSNDPTTREPLSLLGATFVLSMLFASFAATLNSLLLPAFEALAVVGVPLFYFLVVGPTEEFVKWLAIRVHAYHSTSFRTVVDGAVYGAVAGLGFAAIENLIYIVFFSVTATPVETVIEQQYAVAIAVTRSFVGPGHVIFSAWAGFYLGLAKFNPENRVPIILKGLGIAAFIHATYNTLMSVLPLTTLGFVAVVLTYHGFWFGLLYRKIRRYRALYVGLRRDTR
jgi:RsiW-degrading membrane proteinase PrsW (M82 family)